MKLIAVSQRVDFICARKEKRDALDQRLVSFLRHAGFTCVPVSNSLLLEGRSSSREIINDLMSRISPSALLLSGGNDLGEFQDRDDTERILLDYAQDATLPVLGICHGMQMMAVRSGANLKRVQGHVNSRHGITGKISREVNSYHEFSIDECPPGYEVLARSKDGVIKAISHLKLPWEGWMWHPEREDEYSIDDVERLRKLVGE